MNIKTNSPGWTTLQIALLLAFMAFVLYITASKPDWIEVQAWFYFAGGVLLWILGIEPTVIKKFFSNR